LAKVVGIVVSSEIVLLQSQITRSQPQFYYLTDDASFLQLPASNQDLREKNGYFFSCTLADGP
jgi:hypothetical protein